MEKTLAMKTLDGKKIPYEAFSYPDDLRDAEEIAAFLGMPADEVFKTLVVQPPEAGKKPLLVMIPADKQLDLKKLASEIMAKKLKMATHREAESMTGLQVGGISALALINRGFQSLIDSSARESSHVVVSAGKRGLQLRLSVSDLARITNAKFVAVTSEVRQDSEFQ